MKGGSDESRTTNMQLYTIADLNKGIGVFDHVMRSAKEFPSKHTTMPTPVAIGIIAAAIKSGLKREEITDAIDGYFDDGTSDLLTKVRGMYEGDDPRIHLWDARSDGTFSLAWSLDYYSRPDWQVDRYRRLA